jgi:hypothetical protein
MDLGRKKNKVESPDTLMHASKTSRSRQAASPPSDGNGDDDRSAHPPWMTWKQADQQRLETFYGLDKKSVQATVRNFIDFVNGVWNTIRNQPNKAKQQDVFEPEPSAEEQRNQKKQAVEQDLVRMWYEPFVIAVEDREGPVNLIETSLANYRDQICKFLDQEPQPGPADLIRACGDTDGAVWTQSLRHTEAILRLVVLISHHQAAAPRNKQSDKTEETIDAMKDYLVQLRTALQLTTESYKIALAYKAPRTASDNARSGPVPRPSNTSAMNRVRSVLASVVSPQSTIGQMIDSWDYDRNPLTRGLVGCKVLINPNDMTEGIEIILGRVYTVSRPTRPNRNPRVRFSRYQAMYRWALSSLSDQALTERYVSDPSIQADETLEELSKQLLTTWLPFNGFMIRTLLAEPSDSKQADSKTQQAERLFQRLSLNDDAMHRDPAHPFFGCEEHLLLSRLMGGGIWETAQENFTSPKDNPLLTFTQTTHYSAANRFIGGHVYPPPTPSASTLSRSIALEARARSKSPSERSVTTYYYNQPRYKKMMRIAQRQPGLASRIDLQRAADRRARWNAGKPDSLPEDLRRRKNGSPKYAPHMQDQQRVVHQLRLQRSEADDGHEQKGRRRRPWQQHGQGHPSPTPSSPFITDVAYHQQVKGSRLTENNDSIPLDEHARRGFNHVATYRKSDMPVVVDGRAASTLIAPPPPSTSGTKTHGQYTDQTRHHDFHTNKPRVLLRPDSDSDLRRRHYVIDPLPTYVNLNGISDRPLMCRDLYQYSILDTPVPAFDWLDALRAFAQIIGPLISQPRSVISQPRRGVAGLADPYA